MIRVTSDGRRLTRAQMRKMGRRAKQIARKLGPRPMLCSTFTGPGTALFRATLNYRR